MIIAKKSIDRRTFLRGTGAALALPVLDAMTPALTAAAKSPGKPVRRLGYVYIPMGAHLPEWTPQTQGALGELPTILQPLAPFKESVSVLSNLELKNAYSAGNHATANAAFLSAAQAKMTEGSDYELGTTIDQIAAKRIGADTPLPSLELAMDLTASIGNCDNGFACIYQNSLSWASPTAPLPAEAHPRVVFERLFGDGSTAAERQSEFRKDASILDWVMGSISKLQRDLGAEDRSKVAEYIDTIREVERRIQNAEKRVADAPEPDMDRPAGVPTDWADHAKLMFDLQILAMQGDLTRIISFQLARETSTRTYPEIGVTSGHHPTSHHSNKADKVADLIKINTYHVSLFSYYLEKLKATADGEGTLLDHSLILCGSGMGNPDVHDHVDLPILLAGGGVGTHKGGRHIRYAEPTPLANLHLTMLDKMGVSLDVFQDSTGKLDELYDPVSI
mgnify:FL=1|jgi:hypothetical protein